MSSEITGQLNRLNKRHFGVCDGINTAVLSDTVDLINPGWIQPRTTAGDIVVMDMHGNTVTLTFELNEVSLFRVKRILLTGTTASMGIVVYY
jgi:hypothetical protein